MYDSIKADEIKIEQREYIQGVAHEGWLLKQGGKFKTWKKRWVICSGSVLYYFESPKDPTPKNPERDTREWSGNGKGKGTGRDGAGTVKERQGNNKRTEGE